MFGQKLKKTKIWESKKQKLLGIETDRTLRFDEWVCFLISNITIENIFSKL